MTSPFPSLLEALLALAPHPNGGDTGNAFSIEGLAVERLPDGGLRFTVRKLETAALALGNGAFTLQVGRVVLREVVGQLQAGEGPPRLGSLEVAAAEVADLKLQGPLVLPPPAGEPTPAWRLDPLASAEGTVRAEIVDAHLAFDAQVTVPIVRGEVDFDHATVEHVGPDSRMGAAPAGVYVDAPNGRQWVYPFGGAPVAGVAYERRDPLLGLAVLDRGKLQLQAFAEGQLRRGLGAPGTGPAEQARALFHRTEVAADVQLGDGLVAAPGLGAELTGRALGSNLVRVRSESLALGVALEMAALSIGQVQLDRPSFRLACEQVAGGPLLRVFVEGSAWRFGLTALALRATGLQWRPAGPLLA